MIRARVFPLDLSAQADPSRWSDSKWAWEITDSEVPTNRIEGRSELIDWGFEATHDEAVAEAYYAVTMLRLVAQS